MLYEIRYMLRGNAPRRERYVDEAQRTTAPARFTQ